MFRHVGSHVQVRSKTRGLLKALRVVLVLSLLTVPAVTQKGTQSVSATAVGATAGTAQEIAQPQQLRWVRVSTDSATAPGMAGVVSTEEDPDTPENVCGEHCFTEIEPRAYGPYNGKKVYTINLCVEQTAGVDSSGLPVRLAAERWDWTGMFVRHEDHFDLDACWQYNDAATLDVEMTNVADNKCYHFYQLVNQYNTRLRTIGYLNRYYQTCWSNSIRREHYTAAMLGDWLGLARHTGYIWTVMNKNRYDYVRGPLAHDIYSVDALYGR